MAPKKMQLYRPNEKIRKQIRPLKFCGQTVRPGLIFRAMKSEYFRMSVEEIVKEVGEFCTKTGVGYLVWEPTCMGLLQQAVELRGIKLMTDTIDEVASSQTGITAKDRELSKKIRDSTYYNNQTHSVNNHIQYLTMETSWRKFQ